MRGFGVICIVCTSVHAKVQLLVQVPQRILGNWKRRWVVDWWYIVQLLWDCPPAAAHRRRPPPAVWRLATCSFATEVASSTLVGQRQD
jgi:hypothetical protein